MNAIIQNPGDGYRTAWWVNILATAVAAAAVSGLGVGFATWSNVQRMGDRIDTCLLDVRALEDTALEIQAQVTTNTVNRTRN